MTAPRQSATARAEQVVVTGSYRSGTTLLQKRLDAHPACAVVMQPAVPMFRVLRELLHRSGAAVSPPSGPMGIEFPGPAGKLTHAFAALQVDAATVNRVIEATAALAAQSAARSDTDGLHPAIVPALQRSLRPGPAPEFLESFFAALRDYRAAGAEVCIGFKDVYIQELLDPVMACGRHGLRLISIVRDPRAVLASRNFGTFRGAQDGPNLHPILLIARMWCSASRWQHALRQRHGDRVLLVSYEELASATDPAMARVFAYLGLDAAASSDMRAERGIPWRGNSSYEAGPNSGSRPAWQATLPSDAIGAIEFLCGEDMAREGYIPTLSKAEQATAFARYREDAQRLVPWTRLPGYVLDEVTRHDILRAD